MVKIKICGITNLEDGVAAVEAGADLLGFVFHPQSPRYIEPGRVGDIVAALRELDSRVRFAGVFVNAGLDDVLSIMHQARLDLAQLHGSEPAELAHTLAPRCYKALRPRDEIEAHSLIALYAPTVFTRASPAFIVDAYDAKQFGGTGIRADWQIAAGIARSFPILLAGGLTVENVAEAIRKVQPWGVDVSSGVERSPGLKDHTQVRQFVAAARKGEK